MPNIHGVRLNRPMNKPLGNMFAEISKFIFEVSYAIVSGLNERLGHRNN